MRRAVEVPRQVAQWLSVSRSDWRRNKDADCREFHVSSLFTGVADRSPTVFRAQYVMFFCRLRVTL
jgi:hypothetical protein